MRAHKNILVSVLGSTPQILTETLWYLNVKMGIDISNVIVITTSYGKRLICDGDEKTGMPSLLNEVLEKFCDEFGLNIKLDVRNIKVIVDDKGNELEDIRDSHQNEIAADFITREIRNIINKHGSNATIHCSVAGGRKTMSVYAALAMTLVGRKQDKLYHVLVSPPEIEGNPAFFYKPKTPYRIKIKDGREISTDEIEITLAEIPFLRLGEKYGNIFPSEISYVELVKRIQSYVNFEKPAVTGYDDDEKIEIIGENRKFKESLRRLEKYAKNDKVKTILLIGETGTGKELFAKYFHKIGSRKDEDFIAVNCSAIPESLIDTELFGSVRGAYTGAVDKKGIFEEYDGGVVFLDEINRTSLGFQAKLLRFIEQGEIRRVGEARVKKVDVRLIIGLNQEPNEWYNSREVLADFYNRITRHQVRIPPLRERKDDIPALVEYFLKKYSLKYSKNITGVSEEVMKVLQNYDWHMGNVRELEGVIDNMIATADENEQILTRLPEYFEEELRAKKKYTEEIIREISGGEINLTLKELEKIYIEYQLQQNNGNITRTAEKLGLKRSTLQSKMKNLNIVPKNKR